MAITEERKKYLKEYRKTHREQIDASTARWRAKNLDHMRETARKYYQEKVKNDPELKAKRAAYHAKWQRENKAKWNAYNKEYRAKKRSKLDD